jgi:Crinkler effector protein N-terminal domain
VHIVVVLPPPPGECLSCWLAVHCDLKSLNLASDHLTLQCWVSSEHVTRVFPVEIAKAKTVGALKEVIKYKKKNTFRDVDPDALVLWKVSTF